MASNSSITDHLRRLDSINAQLSRWTRDFSPLLSTFSLAADFQRFSESARQLRVRSDRRGADVAVVGATSSGKSLLVNCLLRQEALRSGVGHTTPVAVRIAATDLRQPYFTTAASRDRCPVDLTSEAGRAAFHDKVDAVSGAGLSRCVRLFLARPAGRLLDAGAALVDSPGMEREAFDVAETSSMVDAVDVVLLVVDLTTGVNAAQMQRLLDTDRFLVRPTVLLAFNKADKLQKETADREEQLLRSALSDGEAWAPDAVFFVSAKEAWKNVAREEPNKSQRASFKAQLSQLRPRRRREAAPGVRTTEAGLCSDEPARKEAFRRLETRLVAATKEQRTERVCRALERCVDSVVGEIRRLAEDMGDVEVRLGSLMTAEKENQKEILKEFVVKFYNLHTPDGETAMAGGEKVGKFLRVLTATGREVVARAIIDNAQAEDRRLHDFVGRRLQDAMVKTADREHGKLEHDFSLQLDPVKEAEEGKEVQDLRRRRDALAQSVEENRRQRLRDVEKEVREIVESGNFNGDINIEKGRRLLAAEKQHQDELRELPVRQATLDHEIAQQERTAAEMRGQEILKRRLDHQAVLGCILDQLVAKVAAVVREDFSAKAQQLRESRAVLEKHLGQAEEFLAELKRKL